MRASVNSLTLDARVVERDEIRYTLAGLAILDLVLEHSSEVVEAGQKRLVSMQLRARAMGRLAHELKEQPLLTEMTWQGFLAQGRKGTFQVYFHIQSWQPR